MITLLQLLPKKRARKSKMENLARRGGEKNNIKTKQKAELMENNIIHEGRIPPLHTSIHMGKTSSNLLRKL